MDDSCESYRAAAKNPVPIEVGADGLRGPYQPGLGYRDLLKTSATQAMPVNVWQRSCSR
jgi:hypothetical protein